MKKGGKVISLTSLFIEYLKNLMYLTYLNLASTFRVTWLSTSTNQAINHGEHKIWKKITQSLEKVAKIAAKQLPNLSSSKLNFKVQKLYIKLPLNS